MTKTYIVAMLSEKRGFYPLDTGIRYSREEALDRAKEMNNLLKGELKALDYDTFVAYSLYSE